MLPVAQQLAFTHQQIRAPEHKAELGDLAGLQCVRAQLDPSLRTVDRLPELRGQHDRQQHQRDNHDGVRQYPEDPHGQPAGQHQQWQADAHPGRLPGEHRIGRAQLVERPHAGCRQHHDQPEQQQQASRGEQQVVGGQRPRKHGDPSAVDSRPAPLRHTERGLVAPGHHVPLPCSSRNTHGTRPPGTPPESRGSSR